MNPSTAAAACRRVRTAGWDGSPGSRSAPGPCRDEPMP